MRVNLRPACTSLSQVKYSIVMPKPQGRRAKTTKGDRLFAARPQTDYFCLSTIFACTPKSTIIAASSASAKTGISA